MAKPILHEWKAEGLRIVVINTYDLYRCMEAIAAECAAKKDVKKSLLLRKVYPLVFAAAAEMESYRTNYLDRKAAAEMLVEEVQEMIEWEKKVRNED